MKNTCPLRSLLLGSLPLLTAASLISTAYGQATVSVSSANTSTTVTRATTATFNEINPSTFYGTNGSLLNKTTYYTTPTSLENASANGTATFSGITPAGVLSGVGSFVSGSASGEYGAPTNNATTFLAVGGSNRPGALTLTFSNAGINYFGLNWASPDTFNSIKLTFADGTTSTYTPGTVSGSFNLPAGTTNYFVDFTSANLSNSITQVQLTSTSAAFELDNVAFGVVPEPATWVAGGLVLLLGGTTVVRGRARLAA